MNWESELMRTDVGGRDFAKAVVIHWLAEMGGSNLKLLETATGLSQKILSLLLVEMIEQRVVWLDKAIFRPKWTKYLRR